MQLHCVLLMLIVLLHHMLIKGVLMMILVKINHLVLNSILDHLHNGLNGDRGVVAVSLVVRETDKEQDHAPTLEIA